MAISMIPSFVRVCSWLEATGCNAIGGKQERRPNLKHLKAMFLNPGCPFNSTEELLKRYLAWLYKQDQEPMTKAIRGFISSHNRRSRGKVIRGVVYLVIQQGSSRRQVHSTFLFCLPQHDFLSSSLSLRGHKIAAAAPSCTSHSVQGWVRKSLPWGFFLVFVFFLVSRETFLYFSGCNWVTHLPLN